jgi:hypothetical protein
MSTIDDNGRKASTAHRKLRRLAPRLVSLCEKYRVDNAAVRAVAAQDIETAERFENLFDAVVERRTDRKIELSEEHLASDVLSQAMVQWVGVVSRFRNIDPADYRGSPNVVDDVIAGAVRLVHLVSDDGALAGHPIAAQVRDALTPLIENARKERDEAQALAVETQEMERALRQCGLELQVALKHFRVVLRAEVGRGHRDYQSLRAKRSRGASEPDDNDNDNDDAVATPEPPSAVDVTADDAVIDPPDPEGDSAPADAPADNGAPSAQSANGA